MRIGWTTDTVTGDVGRALHYTLLWGLDGVMLRTVGTGQDRVPFVREGPLRRRLEVDDVPVFAVDPGLFEGDLQARASWMNEIAGFDEVASFCKRFGVHTVQVGALASGDEEYDAAAAVLALRQLGDAAARVGLWLAVRNESDTAVATGTDLATLLKAVDHASVRADWRPLDALRAGEDAETGLEALMEGVPIAMVTVADEGGDGVPAIPGQGQLDWEGIFRAMAANGWDELVSLQVHGRPVGTFGLHMTSAIISATRRAKRSVQP